MNNHLVKMLLVICVGVALLTAGQAFTKDGEKEDGGELDARQLLSAERTERDRVVEGLTTRYHEVSSALLKILEEANTKFRTDRRYHSPLHSAILAVDTWRVIEADALLLSMVDYELDVLSLPDGILVLGDYFYPAASALVHLRADAAKVEEALVATENLKTLRILTWVLLQREGDDIEKVKTTLTDTSNKSRSATEKQTVKKAIELLNKSSDLLPIPSKGGSK